MTAKEKLMTMYPGIEHYIDNLCPENFDILDNPSYCSWGDPDSSDCEQCWNREIPETLTQRLAAIPEEEPDEIDRKMIESCVHFEKEDKTNRTCLGRYIDDYPNDYKVKIGMSLPPKCPSMYGYLEDPTWCNTDGSECFQCWSRYIYEENKPEKEKENSMPTKTVEELAEEKKKLENQIKKAKYDEKCDACAIECKALYDAFIRAGFTETQAFTLTITCIQAKK